MNVSLSRPRSANSPIVAPSQSPELSVGRSELCAGLLADLRGLEQFVDGHAGERRRDEPEVRQHRVAAADVARVQERPSQPVRFSLAASGLPGSVTTMNCSGFAFALKYW